MSAAYSYYTLRDRLTQAVAAILAVDPSGVVIEDPDARFEADLALPCFRYAQSLRQSPPAIAARLAAALAARSDLDFIAGAEAVGGYVNVRLASTQLVHQLRADLRHYPHYGASDQGRGQTIVVDFIGLNLAKPFSVGHLRPTIQGAALINLYRTLGYQVIGDNHLGDWGTPFGMWVVAFKHWGDEAALEREGVYELGRLYVKFRQESRTDPGLLDQAKDWLKKLEQADPEAVALQQRFSALSLRHMHDVLGRLGVAPDENLGESFYIEQAPAFIAQLIQRGIAIEQADGSVVVDLSDAGIDLPILLRKSDGSFLYATTDILTIAYRIQRWQPSKIIYSVGAEQQLHFRQVFALAHKLGYHTELIHAWFGTIDELDHTGKRQKMSSRKSISLLERLLDVAEDKARALFPDGSPTDIHRIAIGAVKFSDFSQSRHQNILFDWDTMFSLNGFSGPYIQYATIRLRSILRKAGTVPPLELAGDYDWAAEHPLLLLISKYPAVLQAAADQNDLHPLARYSYQLARELNHYYEKAPVLTATPEIKAKRLWIITLVEGILSSGLGILGIEVPPQM